MIVRTVVTVLYIAVVIVALVLQFFFPFLATLLLYGLLAWFVASFFVYRLPVMSRVVFRRRPSVTGAPSAPLGVPLSGSDGAPLSGGPLGFCTYCGTSVEPGTVSCPSCGRAIPGF